MHRVQYRVVETVDPVLDLLYENPARLLEKRYAGYLVFLFGRADEEFATWFARNIVALDSLTGSDIGGAIFASRIKLRVHSPVGNASPRRSTAHLRNGDSDIDLGTIHRISEPLIDSSGRSRWRGDEEEITAMTYATDDIARRLGVLPDLPCLVVIDAVPSDEIEVMRLTEYAMKDLIPLVREVVHRFRGSQEFQPFFESLYRVQRLSEKRHSLTEEIAVRHRELQQAKRRVEYALAGVPAEARKALVEANVRRFRDAVLHFPPAARNGVEERAAQARSLQQQLHRFNKTIWSLTRYQALPWPLPDGAREAYRRVYATHVRDLLSPGDEPDVIDPGQCERTMVQLASAQAKTVDYLLEGLPTTPEMQALVDRQHAQHCGPIERQLEDMHSASKQLDTEIEEELRRLLAIDCPSLKTTFRAIARNKRIDTARKKAGEGVLSFSAGLLKPETLIKLWQFLTSH